MRLLAQNGTSCSLLRLNNGKEILFSYSTPVAGFIPERGYFQTSVSYSTTTTRHINGYLRGNTAVIFSQEEVDSLLS